MPAYLKTILLLICSNAFMTFAWYGHLKNSTTKPLFFVILFSWFIAFFEYLFQIPANRIGFTQANLSLAELRIVQEVISLTVFILFSVLYMKQPLRFNYLLAGVCLIGAVFFIFKK
jgi:uncharacterized protein